jgi:hypothetical protein
MRFNSHVGTFSAEQNHKDVKNKRVLDYVIIAGHDAAARGPLTVAESH